MRQLLEPCLPWKGSVDTATGYAYTQGKKASRVLYIKAFGPQPGLEVDHLCHNRLCVNLEHLEAVTREENLRRKLTKRLCKKGHSNWAKSPGYNRFCRTCASDNQRALRAKRFLSSP